MKESIKILLADNYFLVRKGLRHLLKEELPASFIEEAEDSETLIKKVMEQDWDLVITDLVMPGRGVLEAIGQIKKEKPYLPLLILSTYSEELFAIRALKAGASGYLTKDIKPEELIKAIQTVMSGKKYITPVVAERLTEVIDGKRGSEVHERLSDREFEVFKMLANGTSITKIGETLFLSASTISTYRSRILSKMHFKTNADLVVYATRKEII